MNKSYLIVILLSLVLSACAAKTGHQFLDKMPEHEIAAKLVKDQTTKDQVKLLFGDPEDIDIRENGEETWIYKFVRSQSKGVNFIPYANLVMSGTNDNIKRLKILFGSDDIIKKFAFSNAKGETKMGLFQ